MVVLIAPETVVLGQPFAISFRSEERVAGRFRLTAGTEVVPFVLARPDRVDEASTGHRVRGRAGDFTVSDWGEHEVGAELVLRFEGAKRWMTVAAG